MKPIRFTFLLLLTLLLVACGGDGSANDDGTLRVVATTGQIADAVQNVAGDTVQLDSLLGPGVDPHVYLPTEGDVNLINDADVIFYNGLELEAQMIRVLDQMSERGATVVSIGDSLPEDRLLRWTDDTKVFDPHAWNDPPLWSLGIELIRDTLVEANPDSAEIYTTNADTYLAEIAETHAFLTDEMAKIPDNRRFLVTAHDAFGYFGRTYNMEVVGLQGISTESEAGTADVQNLADFIVENDIPAIFVETSVSDRTIRSVQEAARAQGHTVEIGGSLFSDALGEPGTDAETYIGMLRHNATTIANALSE